MSRDSVRALMGNITRRRLVCWYLCVVATLTVLSGVLHGLIAPPMGLVRTFYATSGFSGEPLSQDRTTEISLAFPGSGSYAASALHQCGVARFLVPAAGADR